MTTNLAWTILFIAGFFEVGWAIGLKYTQGFTRPLPSFLTIMAMIISMYLLGKAANVLPISTAYGVWVGVGAVGAAILGVVLFQEPISIQRSLFILLLIISIIGLKFS
jgi:quaternary ammonium compound-resistance protein SugE